jgi:titin
VLIVSGIDNTIGGTAAGSGNVISGNGSHGIRVDIFNPGSFVVPVLNTVIQGNRIGTDHTGTADLGNAESGVFLRAATDTTIGGAAAGAGNVISGNGSDGISTESVFIVFSDATSDTVIQGNRIGTDIAGASAIANGGHGIALSGTRNSIIGGSSASAGNVISGNALSGIAFIGQTPSVGSGEPIASPTENNVIQGNRIGVDNTGTNPIPNGGAGVLIVPTSVPLDITGNTIGGTAAGEGNTIRFNGSDGISALGGVGNQFLRNSIDLNGGLGIDLAEDGVTPNDAADADVGANNRQNFPVVTSVNVAVATNVNGTFHGTPNRTFRIEFFNSPAADPSGFGEGRTFLGFIQLTTDVSGNSPFAASLPPVAGGTVITTTATDLTTLDTSEFSNAVEAVLIPPTLNDPTGIPTVTQWGLLLLAMFLAIGGTIALRS